MDAAPASTGRARTAAAPALRRGLPRVPGGEAWPPAAASAGSRADFVQPGADFAPASAGGARNAAPVAAPEPAASDVREAGSSRPPETEVAATAAVGGRMLRRGLPRVPGGEPWPPAGIAAPASVAPPAEAPRAASHTAAASVDTDAPAPASEPAAAAPAPAASAVELAPASAAAPAVPDGPRPPLPFPRTVRAGAAASAPRTPAPEPVRIGPYTRGQWAGATLVVGAALLIAAGMAVAAVRFLLSTTAGQDFLAAFPGEYHLPASAPVGLPAWLGWQHFLNGFFMLLIIRTGLQVRREKRPSIFWSPRGNKKRKISLALWTHQAIDLLWVLNGVVFIVLLFVTGQWMRIVPTSWEVVPNAISAGLQYVSLDWPTENGWVNYNSLQQLAYFATTFIAAPLAIVTGVRMSGLWPKNAATLNRLYPVEWARKVHYPVMLYFVAFIVVHVALVFATGALRNLNHMYAAQDAVNWTGFWIFVASLVVMAAGWIAARPLVLVPIARLFGTVKGR
ncbi:cytochrome b/b6 domain-containing protein [Microbacterium sp. 10M-3C3]|uniref:cytochrome b/b6 domain-containing protein n=1 Tax=Microbacterium sp. 10M-3C3 TaxID=2483401 RepID=UPI001F0C7CAC|nr:cytochrome b/b6 domain-containing protein [Microbacterium sp. 10M-3C3]